MAGRLGGSAPPRKAALILALLLTSGIIGGPAASGSDGQISHEGSAPGGTDNGLAPTLPAGITALATDDLGDWKERAEAIIDDTTLANAYSEAGYRLPIGSEVYVVEIVDGVDRPAYLLYEAGEGAFSIDFWPASTVKVLAAVAAVTSVGELGFSGSATASFQDGFASTLRSLYRSAITVSANDAYDRLLQIAGLDYVNGEFLVDHRLDSMRYGSSYSGLSVLDPPGYTLSEHDLGPTKVSARVASQPFGVNDTDLFDLVEGLRKIVLATELDEDDRFDLSADDLKWIQRYLERAKPSFFEAGVVEVLGDDAIVSNKAGWVPGRNCVDHAFIIDPSSGRRFLLAATAPFSDECPDLSEMAARSLQAVLDAGDGMTAEPDSGVAIDVNLGFDGEWLFVGVGAEADEVLITLDGRRPVTAHGGSDQFARFLRCTKGGDHVMKVVVRVDERPVGCVTVGFTLPPTDGPPMRNLTVQSTAAATPRAYLE